MQINFAKTLFPALLLLLASAPAGAQIRLGLDLPSIHIRIAPEGPPPPRVEVRHVRPSRNHVWIQGYWDRQGDQWSWASGRWERPSRRGSVWVKPRYKREGGSVRYEPAHWSHERMVEGEDYTRWHRERGDKHRGRGRGHDKHRGD